MSNDFIFPGQPSRSGTPITAENLVALFTETFGDFESMSVALKMLSFQVQILAAEGQSEYAQQQAQDTISASIIASEETQQTAQAEAQAIQQQAQEQVNAATTAFNEFVASLQA